MLRITTVDSGNHAVTLRLEGRVVGPWVDEFRAACDALMATGRSFNVDLMRVAFADDTGIDLLCSLKERGVALNNPSPFLEEELKT